MTLNVICHHHIRTEVYDIWGCHSVIIKKTTFKILWKKSSSKYKSQERERARSSRTLTFWSMYNLLINLLSHQSIPVLFRICINLVQFTRSNAFCQSMKQIHSSSSTSIVRSAIIRIIPIASLVPYPLLNPNWSSPSTSSIFLSILLLIILAIIFAVC